MAAYSNLSQQGLEDPNNPVNDPAYSQLGLNPGANASDTYAALSRQQWQLYMQNFVPIENQLIDFATNKALPGQAMNQAITDVNQSYTAQQGAFQREMTGMGVQLTPQQQAARTREQGLSQALARVQGANTARDLTIANQQAVLGNPSPTTESIASQATQLGS
jgi:hypothetical protein